VLEVLSRPVASAGAVVEEVRRLAGLRGEVVRLREENERLRNWQAAARQLRHENAAYRDLLNVVEEPRLDFITARVISDSGGAFVRTVLIAAGTDSGVRKGQAVVNGDGLVGRIVEAGRHSARVLLLTDLNARIPVVIESSRVSAILAGDNTDRQRLIFMPDNARASPGDRIVTSGRGEMLPAGLPIGTVVSVADGVARVQPFAVWHTLEYVRVLDLAYPAPSASAAGAAPAGRER
jgi:rod shape-determining protein MreC